MKTNIGRKSLALIAVACGMAGCSKREAPVTPTQAPSAATAAEPTASASAGAISPGIYEVCEVAATMHGDVKGDHLSGMKVEIRQINPKEATAVCIGADGCPDDLADKQFAGTVLWMIGDAQLLRAVNSFEHHPESGPGTTSMAHLVQILKDPIDQPPESCEKGNVLIMRICHPADDATPDAQWRCDPSAGPHGADAHIQN